MGPPPRLSVFACLVLAASTLVGAALPAPATAFSRLVDEYLDWFAAHHPSIAAGNGLHQYDGRLEDFSAPAIAAEVVDLGGWQKRLRAIDTTRFTADERVDDRILSGIVDAWVLDLADVQTWRTNPMIYAAAITVGASTLMTTESAPAATRMRLVTSKLEGVPQLVASARENVTSPPAIFAARGASMFRAGARLLRDDLPKAFAGGRDARRFEAMRATAVQAAESMESYADHLEREVVRADGSFAIGRAHLEARFRAEELIDLPVDQLLAIGERELAKAEEEFRATADRLSPGRDPAAVWADVQRDHPSRGALVDAAARAVKELSAFVVARRLLALPPHAPVLVVAARDFEPGRAAMHAAPPMETTPVKSRYAIRAAPADWPADRQEAWLQAFNYPTLADITAHEVYPGHYAQSLFMRRTPGRIRRIWLGLNPFPQPSSGQDGWAHYAEQLVQDEGFHRAEPQYKLAQVAEALTRICRLIAGVRLHTGDWTVDEAAAYFQAHAHLPAPVAREEAERGTYDPTYGGYLLGKLAALKLRGDVARRQGSRFDLRAFHTRLLTNGIAPWWSHRQLLLPGDTGAVLE